MPKKHSTSRGRGRDRSHVHAASTSQAPPTSPERPTTPAAESDTQSETSQRNSPTKMLPSKKSRVLSDLAIEDEEAMVEWLKEHPILYNKKLALYKDKGKKDSLWAEQATLLGKNVLNLTVWYRSIRTRYGRLVKKKSGAGAGERTDRDNWILEKFEFLKGHIHEVQPRTVVSIKDKLAAQPPADDDGDSQDLDDDIQSMMTTSAPSMSESTERPVVLDVRPKRSSSRATAEEERLLTTLEERGRQSMQLQEKLVDLIKPTVRPTERSTYGDWAKSVMEGLDSSLWRQFQQEHSQLLYKFLDMNDHVRMGAQSQYQAQPPQQQRWQHDSGQQQQYGNPQPGSFQTQECSQWQPPPQSWPVTVQSTSLCNSQSSSSIQSQMAPETTLITLQPRPRSTPQNASTPTTNSCSVPITSATSTGDNEVLGLSGVFNDSFVDELNRRQDENNNN